MTVIKFFICENPDLFYLRAVNLWFVLKKESARSAYRDKYIQKYLLFERCMR